jgi:hypothetical protein
MIGWRNFVSLVALVSMISKIHCEDATKFIDCTYVTLSDSTTYTVPDDLDCTAGAGQQRKTVVVSGTGVVVSLLKTTAVTTLKNVRFIILNGASVSFQLADYPANSSGSLKLVGDGTVSDGMTTMIDAFISTFQLCMHAPAMLVSVDCN